MKKWLWCPGFGQSAYAGAVMGYVSTVHGYGDFKLSPEDLAERYRSNAAAIRKVLQRLVDDGVLVKLSRSKYRLSPAGLAAIEEFKSVSFGPQLLDDGMTPKEAAILSAVGRAKTQKLAAEWVGVSKTLVTRTIQKRDTAQPDSKVEAGRSATRKRDTAQPKRDTAQSEAGHSATHTLKPYVPDKESLPPGDGFARAADLLCTYFKWASLPPMVTSKLRAAWDHTLGVSTPPYTEDQIVAGIKWILDGYSPKKPAYIFKAMAAEDPGDHPAGIALAQKRKEDEDDRIAKRRGHERDLAAAPEDPRWEMALGTIQSSNHLQRPTEGREDHSRKVREQADRIRRKGK